MELSPATATVTFIKAGAYSTSGAGAGEPYLISNGPNVVSTVIGDGGYNSKSGSYDEHGLAQASAYSLGAIQLDSVSKASFFVSSTAKVQAPAHEFYLNAETNAAAYYDFSLDTASTLSFTGFATPASPDFTNNISVSLVKYTALGAYDTIYRSGYLGASETGSYALGPGIYAFEVDTFSAASATANNSIFSSATIGAVGNVSLSITSPPPPSPAPEPATWAMMVFGFGATGAAIRSRRKALSAA
ncbi:PEPxxWA-CTERM sorting domain-containing protein [Sphingomonas nostoxanthinifaciens]|uniref:PEPxxWA-CTERM sorting domain-containing protein n=1 Tax=Sphingomonas nostoxanthinifaciens TaxID=2872652 RepID=UPI001CC1C7F9|nr:PEPxxWA-CTERM sorting domain-containing protein [Sphingomonas nostoxanthinifaciens]UAK25417.1 PEPxxWA-CTERM sorting domain-containing protein [Sphingomonas nostoxanthinifaciens]